MKKVELYLKPLDKDNKTQQFISSVVMRAQLSGPCWERQISDKIEMLLDIEETEYYRELNFMIQDKDYPTIYFNGSYYRKIAADYFIPPYIVEIKCKPQLGVPDKTRLGEYMQCSGIDGVILAHYNDNPGELIKIGIVDYCQSGVYIK